MRLGIDFGTTRTIVAAADRGNYPVVTFTNPDGDDQDFLPSTVARRGEGLVFGFDALCAGAEGAEVVRSFKRALGDPTATAQTTLTIGGRRWLLLDVLTGFLTELRRQLLDNCSISRELRAGGIGPIVVGVPAHAHSAQRFLTLEAFRAAGFEVSAMLNEPSAAGFEYTHRQERTITSRRTRVLVYDLGGGTFDASLTTVEGIDHEVLGSLGLNRLGGDDFDEVLADCALRLARSQGGERTTRADLSDREWADLLDQARDAKEHLSPQTRRIPLEVLGTAVIVPVDEFYDRASALVESTIEAMTPLVAQGGETSEAGTVELSDDLAGIYLVGGGSGLPLVPRRLRERFGRRVYRSPHPAASTAIGLAIAADAEAGYSLTDQVSRGCGVFREWDAGAAVSFDAVVDRTVSIPAGETYRTSRRYQAAHNLGCFRFVEYTRADEDGHPIGDIAPYQQVRFPFDPTLREEPDLNQIEVVRIDNGPLIEETYVVDENGIITVHLTDLTTDYSRSYSLTTLA